MSASELAIQIRRHANLRHLIKVLDAEGIQSWSQQAEILANMTGARLKALMDGEAITDTLAREIEWAMQRPDGWLDRQPEDVLGD